VASREGGEASIISPVARSGGASSKEDRDDFSIVGVFAFRRFDSSVVDRFDFRVR
jgi:hypothetical protein